MYVCIVPCYIPKWMEHAMYSYPSFFAIHRLTYPSYFRLTMELVLFRCDVSIVDRLPRGQRFERIGVEYCPS